MQNILLVSYCDFPGNGSIHVHHFANSLVKLGIDCVVVVPFDKKTISTVGSNLYKVTQFDEIGGLIKLFDNQQGPDVVHAWTPREHVRKYCAQVETSFRFKQFIHLEDNEETILERFLDQPMAVLLQESPASDSTSYLSHPKKYQEFLSSADGITVIMDRLQEFVPEQIPSIILWPGVDTQQFFSRPANVELAKSLGIPDSGTVLCYPGAVHLANIDEVRSLYRVVGKRNLEGKPTVLIRTGVNVCDVLTVDESWINQYIIELGLVERAKIPDILSLADVLIQPGSSDDFNDYRLPSKIPEFLAMGKPVIVPETNIGRFLTHLKNAIVLPTVDEAYLSDAIDRVLQDRALAQKLSEGAVEFARSRLDWDVNTQQLKAFYQSLLTEGDELTSLTKAFGRMQRQARDQQVELRQTQAESMHFKQVIQSMESSKFWKLREAWLQAKRYIGLKGD
jgi:glycosyltransferase involved in cell wall biosynthesis